MCVCAGIQSLTDTLPTQNNTSDLMAACNWMMKTEEQNERGNIQLHEQKDSRGHTRAVTFSKHFPNEMQHVRMHSTLSPQFQSLNISFFLHLKRCPNFKLKSDSPTAI